MTRPCPALRRALAVGMLLLPLSLRSVLPAETHSAEEPQARVLAMLWSTRFLAEDEAKVLLPRFVLYDDGTLFYVQPHHGKWKPYTTRLDEQTFKQVGESFAATDAYMDLEDFYDLDPCLLDAPRVRIYLANGSRGHAVTLTGYDWDGGGIFAWRGDCGDPRGKVPGEAERILNLVRALKPVGGKQWSPSKYFVHLREWDHPSSVTGEPVKWPERWPVPVDEIGPTNGAGAIRFVLLGGSKERKLRRLLDAELNDQPILIKGRLYEFGYDAIVEGTESFGFYR